MEVEGASFITVSPTSDFSLQNIPFGVISQKSAPEDKRPATRIGDFAIDLKAIENLNLLNGPLLGALNRKLFQSGYLNEFMALEREYWVEARQTIQSLFSAGSAAKEQLQACIYPIDQIINHVPAQIGDYTDFYSSKNHAFNVGVIIRGKDNAMQPNWYHLPVGYHGRASTVVIDGTDILRPRGQTKAPTAENPSFTDCKRLDFELEVGAFLGGAPNKQGHPIKVNEAERRLFGLVLLNDWSARDIQTWEYVPLGPFNAKNFATTISPWIVTIEAIEQFRLTLPEQSPSPLPYLAETKHTSFDINLEVYLKPQGSKDSLICKSNFKYLYWSIAQQIAHHSVTGCSLHPGDLLGSGTISGETKDSFGSMLELSWSGKELIKLEDGQERTFINDGDTITMKGFAGKEGARVGFGECKGTILPALNENQYY